MVTPQQAEELARKAVEDYVNQCHCKSKAGVADVLMKLTSMCGMGMSATVGHEETASRLQEVTNYIAEAAPDFLKVGATKTH